MKFIKKHGSFLYPIIFFGSVYLISWIDKHTDDFVSWISWIITIVIGLVVTMVIYSWQELQLFFKMSKA